MFFKVSIIHIIKWKAFASFLELKMSIFLCYVVLSIIVTEVNTLHCCTLLRLIVCFPSKTGVMALSNAERQKLWRERQKRRNKKAFMAKERERKRRSYIPVGMLSKKELKVRRRAVLNRVNKHKKRQIERTETITTRRLIVKLPALSRRKLENEKTAKKLMKQRSVCRRASVEVANLRKRNRELLKQRQKLKKRLDRQKKLTESTREQVINHTSTTDVPASPRAQTRLDCQSVGQKIHTKFGKRMLIANSVLHPFKVDLKSWKRKAKRNAKPAMEAVSKLLKKYRLISAFSKATRNSRSKIIKMGRDRKENASKTRNMKGTVVDFLEREDNSSPLPGKKDSHKENSVIKQKRVLHDYMKNLHLKFLTENPRCTISRASFCRLRPPHLILASFATRKTCLCSRHQNLLLKLKCLRRNGIKCTLNPDNFISQNQSDEGMIENIDAQLPTSIATMIFKEWKRVCDKGKFRWKEVQTEVTRREFLNLLRASLPDFRAHVGRIAKQYKELRKLRENLKEGEVLVWMDFAENYTCSAMEEVQSAYWNAQSVSLHTMVTYFPQKKNKECQSYVGVSQNTSHNAKTVFTILKAFIPLLKKEYPLLQKIHYLTDSPTSQYRNKTIFQMLCNHKEHFGVEGEWNFLESGHGKGPCDGLGGSVKRSADMAVKRGKFAIQDASDFIRWTESEQSSKVVFFSYTQDDINRCSDILSENQAIKPIPGTFKLHAVKPVGKHSVAVRETSCYCDMCRSDPCTSPCSGWKVHSLLDNTRSNVSIEALQNCSVQGQDEYTGKSATPDESSQIHRTVGDWVVARYDGKRYIGQIIKVDEEDAEINFMEFTGEGNRFLKWPKRKDKIWVDNKDILQNVPSPSPTKKNKCLFFVEEHVFMAFETE
ncbi:uncharacterized protein LOC135156857 [Lytechinus pictus]|uniref:uncharacterized protein LOC135156857 n=1 Tax=Lytechinus pictus TaxID=7653 RepID=UPI0030BA028D